MTSVPFKSIYLWVITAAVAYGLALVAQHLGHQFNDNLCAVAEVCAGDRAPMQ